MKPERERFFRSQTAELQAVANRVRYLIGDAHWYTDGAFKEAVLLNAVRARLRAGVTARRGFVLASSLDQCSKEQDCIVFSSASDVPVFEAVDFHMVTPRGVLALVSVKTTLSGAEVKDAVTGLATALRLIASDPDGKAIPSFVFVFDNDETVKDETVVGWIRDLVSDTPWPILVRDPIGGDIPLPFPVIFTLGGRCVRVEVESPTKRRVLSYRAPELASALFLYMVETVSHSGNPVRGVWEPLEQLDMGDVAIAEF